MAKTKRSWIAIAVIGLAAYGTYRLGGAVLGGTLFGSEEDDHVANQLWVSKLPKSDRELIEHVVLLDTDSGRFGVWGQSSTWKHDIELFKWGRKDNRMAFFFPQSRKRGKGTVKVWDCEDDAPKPFELCLELVADGNKRLYYSRRDWVVEPGATAESLRDIAEDTPELDNHLEHVDGDVEVD